MLSGADLKRLSKQQYIDGILSRDCAILARAITVVESSLPSDTELANEILDGVLPSAGKALRIGITGVPGAGKSTLIDALGLYITEEVGESVAVLSIDPSSALSAGSILGDKTRMARLAVQPNAYIRPSPAGGHAGGVARRTREATILCDAAGFSDILIETVGVGQSETAVRDMADFFLLVLIPGAGDELQGMKRGILEMVDGIVVNKSDGTNQGRAERARVDYAAALHLFPPSPNGWSPEVLTCSARENKGIAEIWDLIRRHQAHEQALGFTTERRRAEQQSWMRELIADGLRARFESHQAVQSLLSRLSQEVRDGTTTPMAAAKHLLREFERSAL